MFRKNERSGKHVQPLEAFLFFNLVHCSIHIIVTLQPFLNTPFPSNKPPPPSFCPSFLAIDPRTEEESKYLLTIQMRNQWQVVSKEKKRFKTQKQRNNEDGTQSIAKVSDNSIAVAAKNSFDYKFVLFFCHSSFMPFVLCT